MNPARNRFIACTLLLAGVGLGGCTATTYDYTAFQQYPPRSILILPPLNESTSLLAPYSYLSTVSKPVAERGYYVFPVMVVDQLLKENGMPTAGEMHEISLPKVYEVTGADAVLYITLQEYGSQYIVISSDTKVRVTARLVDTRTSTLLWEGTGFAQSSSGTGFALLDVVSAAVVQAINSVTDPGRSVSRAANQMLFEAKGKGLPWGPYHPKFGKYP
jgi:hypothetical protein